MELKTKRLVLRELNDKDLTNLVRLVNNLNITQFLRVVPHPYAKKDGEWFINKTKEDSKKDPRENYELTIEYEGKLVGIVGLTDVDNYHGTASLGYWLGEDFWRNGIMFEATSEIIRFAFEDLKLRRIDVEADIDNDGSNGLIKKLGFDYEGLRKKYRRNKATGKVVDVNVYGLLNENSKSK